MNLELSDVQPRYMFLDPAGTKKSQIKGVRARSAIVVCGVDAFSRMFVLDAWADRVSTNEIRRRYLDMYQYWNPILCGYEDVAQQSLLEDPLMDEAFDRGINSFPLVAITPTTKVDKTYRIRSIIQRVYGTGRLIIRKDLIELVDEITSFPMSTTRDLMDALASCIDLIPPVTTKKDVHDEAHELARYLRESGVAPHEIEERLRDTGAFGYDEGGPWWERMYSKRRIQSGAYRKTN